MNDDISTLECEAANYPLFYNSTPKIKLRKPVPFYCCPGQPDRICNF